MKQSNHPHGLKEHEISTTTDFKRETNPFGHTFSFERMHCAHCFKWLGDSSPMLIKATAPHQVPDKRIIIQVMTCKCKKMHWEDKSIFPYTTENLMACKT